MFLDLACYLGFFILLKIFRKNDFVYSEKVYYALVNVLSNTRKAKHKTIFFYYRILYEYIY